MLALVLLAAPASSLLADPAPLIVGTVRDQTGAPVAGARVNGIVATDTDGTFALPVSNLAGISSVEIRCRFCRTKTVPVAKDGTVVAIVQRYLALVNTVPNSDDLATLPYAHTESALALTPFTVLENSSAVIPGPSLSDHGVQSSGGLIVAAGVPVYDVAAGISPLYFDPQHYMQSVEAFSQSDAFRYGDLADGVIYLLDPQAENEDASVYGGNESIRFGASSARDAFSVGASGNADEQQRRFDVSANAPLGDTIATISAAGSDALLSPNGYNTLQAGLSSLNFSLEQVRAVDVRIDFYTDRASYAALYHGSPLDETWSDTNASITVRPAAPPATMGIAPCATFGVRTSTGIYDAYASGIPNIGAAITQGQSVFGLSAQGANYHVTAGLGVYAIGYSGGIFGVSLPATAQATSPVMRVQLALNEHWSIDTSISGGFSLPLFTENYGNVTSFFPVPPGITTLPGNNLVFDRNSTVEGTLEYSDASRMRLGVTALSRNVSGIDQGRITSAGGSFAWQITPAISLRTWWLRVTPALTVTVPTFRFGVPARPANAGSAWLSYENNHFLRLDIIWRQDLLDYQPDVHLDASVSAPLNAASPEAFVRSLRWYVGTERYQGTRTIDAGLRFSAENP